MLMMVISRRVYLICCFELYSCMVDCTTYVLLCVYFITCVCVWSLASASKKKCACKHHQYGVMYVSFFFCYYYIFLFFFFERTTTYFLVLPWFRIKRKECRLSDSLGKRSVPQVLITSLSSDGSKKEMLITV